MMKQNKALIEILKLVSSLFFLAFVISSCNVKNNNEYKLLELKYKVLEDENRKLNERFNALSIRPIVIPKSAIINLGEEYIADVRLAMVDTNYPPISILCRFDNKNKKLIPTGDTLIYNSDTETSTYKNSPKTKGLYQWSGKIIQKQGEKTLEFGFTAEYLVK